MLKAMVQEATAKPQDGVEPSASRAAAPQPVAVMIGQLTQGGSERQLYAFLAHCDRTRWSPVVYVSGELGFWEEPIRQLGIPIVLLKGGRLAKMRQFRKACIAQGAKHFFSWSSYTNGFGLALAGCGVRRIGSYRNAGFSDLPARHQWLWSWMSLAGISTAVCNSRGTERDIGARFGRGKRAVYVPNAVKVFPVEQLSEWRRQWRERLGLSDQDILVLGVGRIEPAKGFPRFIDAIDQVRREVPVKAVIAGQDQGSLQALQNQVAELGLQDTIRFIGRVPDARELMCAADIFLLSSEREGMPNVVLEAMSAGVASVATDVGAVPDVIQHGVNGFIAEREASALAQHVTRLARDEKLRRSVGARAREEIVQNYQSEPLVRQLWALCE